MSIEDKLSLAKFLESNKDDILHNNIYQLLVNYKLTEKITGNTDIKIFNINDLSPDILAQIIKMFIDRKTDIKLRTDISGTCAPRTPGM